MDGLNPELVLMARHTARQHQKQAQQKRGFVPSDLAAQTDPSGGGGGGPPGMPPGGMPPGGPPSGPSPGGPPPDAMGGAPPPSGPDPMSMLQPMIQQAVQQAMMQGGGGGGGAGGAGGAGGMKPPKPDLNMVATDVFQLKKLMFSFFRQMGWEPPQDILDGPGRDPATGAPAAGPMGGSDPNMGAPGGDMGGGAGGQPGSAIAPIQPMEGASPALAAAGKQASWQDRNELLYRYAGYDLDQLQQLIKQATVLLSGLPQSTEDAPRIGAEVVTGRSVLNKAAALAMRLRRQQEPLSA